MDWDVLKMLSSQTTSDGRSVRHESVWLFWRPKSLWIAMSHLRCFTHWNSEILESESRISNLFKILFSYLRKSVELEILSGVFLNSSVESSGIVLDFINHKFGKYAIECKRKSNRFMWRLNHRSDSEYLTIDLQRFKTSNTTTNATLYSPRNFLECSRTRLLFIFRDDFVALIRLLRITVYRCWNGLFYRFASHLR